MFRLLRFAFKNYRYAIMGYTFFKSANSKYKNKKGNNCMKQKTKA